MEKIFSLADVLAFEQRYRASFINSLWGFKSLAVIGTRSNQGNTNLAVFNSLFHLGAHPPLVGFIIRPDSTERHTLSNILETSVLTINHVTEEMYEKAHQTSARYEKSISEFDAVQLTEEYTTGFYAPFVKESAIKIGATLQQKIDLDINGTILIIAKLSHLIIPDSCIMSDGFIDLEKAGTITCSGLDSYHVTKKIARLTYAKPFQTAEKI